MSRRGGLIAQEVVGATAPGLILADANPSTAQAVGASGWIGKRILDVVLSIVLLLVTLPLLLAVAVLIRLTSDGPVLFRQHRVGRGGEEFRMLKFRTMHLDSETRLHADSQLYELFLRSSHKIPAHLDPRVTPIGRILRRFSLDELPQLLNVLVGHMSVVGPRPVERSQLIRDYQGYEPAYTALRPGLTGLWQVSGRSTVHFPERAQLDSDYVRACGPWIDAKIILRTPMVVFNGLGAD
jgi:lipopolysaccharide/colanic/teichoic acid biosynthesis glycosyltransferase